MVARVLVACLSCTYPRTRLFFTLTGASVRAATPQIFWNRCGVARLFFLMMFCHFASRGHPRDLPGTPQALPEGPSGFFLELGHLFQICRPWVHSPWPHVGAPRGLKRGKITPWACCIPRRSQRRNRTHPDLSNVVETGLIFMLS